jgi:hypothetical protein
MTPRRVRAAVAVGLVTVLLALIMIGLGPAPSAAAVTEEYPDTCRWNGCPTNVPGDKCLSTALKKCGHWYALN